MTNKEKFLALVSQEKDDTLDYIKERIRNRPMIEESQRIAWKVLDRLDELGWSQKDLAKKMEVTPPQVNKIVKGQENLTLATIVKLQEILNIAILASCYEKKLEHNEESQGGALKQYYIVPKAKKIQYAMYRTALTSKKSISRVEEPSATYHTYINQV